MKLVHMKKYVYYNVFQVKHILNWNNGVEKLSVEHSRDIQQVGHYVYMEYRQPLQLDLPNSGKTKRVDQQRYNLKIIFYRLYEYVLIHFIAVCFLLEKC